MTTESTITDEDKSLKKTSDLILTCITYNVNRQPAPEVFKLNHLFSANDLKSDFIAIGIQEHSIDFYNTFACGESAWAKILREKLYPNEFVEILPTSTPKLFGVYTILFMKRKHLGIVQNIEVKTCQPTLNYLDVKSTVGISICLRYNTRITIVNTHMIHGQQNLNTRIRDFHLLRSKMQFEPRVDLFISDDFLVIMGDFNSRSRSTETRQLIASANLVRKRELNQAGNTNPDEDYEYESSLKYLLMNDQLLSCKRAGEMANEVEEAPITFAPTYRFIVGTEDYDEVRDPSYCDRVLFACNEVVGAHQHRPHKTLKLACTAYEVVHGVTISDHLPVRATFKLTMPVECLESQNLIEFLMPKSLNLVQFVQNNANLLKFIINDPSYDVSALDWVGIYSEPIEIDSVPLAYRYCAPSWHVDKCIDSKMPDHWCLTTTAAMFAQKPGRYRLGYYSRARNTLMGISDVFELIPHDTY